MATPPSRSHRFGSQDLSHSPTTLRESISAFGVLKIDLKRREGLAFHAKSQLQMQFRGKCVIYELDPAVSLHVGVTSRSASVLN